MASECLGAHILVALPVVAHGGKHLVKGVFFIIPNERFDSKQGVNDIREPEHQLIIIVISCAAHGKVLVILYAILKGG